MAYLKNKFLNTKSDYRKAYNIQRNYVFRLLRNEKKNIYDNLHIMVVTDNRVLWKLVKPSLSDEVTKNSKINLAEDDKIIGHDDQIAKMVSKYFINILIINTPSNGLTQLTQISGHRTCI